MRKCARPHADVLGDGGKTWTWNLEEPRSGESTTRLVKRQKKAQIANEDPSQSAETPQPFSATVQGLTTPMSFRCPKLGRK